MSHRDLISSMISLDMPNAMAEESVQLPQPRFHPGARSGIFRLAPGQLEEEFVEAAGIRPGRGVAVQKSTHIVDHAGIVLRIAAGIHERLFGGIEVSGVNQGHSELIVQRRIFGKLRPPFQLQQIIHRLPGECPVPGDGEGLSWGCPGDLTIPPRSLPAPISDAIR